jgi:predicted transcriptional regulator
MNESEDQGNRLGEILVEQGSLSADELEEALQIQGSDSRKIGQILVSRGYVKRHHTDIALAKQKKMRA